MNNRILTTLYIVVLLLSFNLSFAQLNLSHTFPVFELIDADKSKYESSIWEYGFLDFNYNNDQTVIDLKLYNTEKKEYRTIKELRLTKVIMEWDHSKNDNNNDNYSTCVMTNDKNEFYAVTVSLQYAKQVMIIKLNSNLRPTDEVIVLRDNPVDKFERITYLNNDGLTGFSNSNYYYGVLTNRSYNMFTRRTNSDQLLYTNNSVKIEEGDLSDVMIFPLDRYNTNLYKVDFSNSVKFEDDTYTYSTEHIDGFIGFTTDKGYDKFKYCWFVPDNIEIMDFTSNRKGTWEKIDNGIIFTGAKGINNVHVEISYKVKNPKAKEIEKTEVKLKEKIALNSKVIDLDIWDNNVEDGDVISLSLNGEWIIRNLKVKKCKTSFNLNLKEGENYLIMKAENIGERPPNTAAFLFQTETEKKEVTLDSDYGTSEMIQIEVIE